MRLPPELRQLIQSYYDRRFNRVLTRVLESYLTLHYKRFGPNQDYDVSRTINAINTIMLKHGMKQTGLKVVPDTGRRSIVLFQREIEVVSLELILEVIKWLLMQFTNNNMIGQVNSWLLAMGSNVRLVPFWNGSELGHYEWVHTERKLFASK